MQWGDTSVKHKGFTLVELMITLIIAAILLAVAAPGFRSLIERNRLQSAGSNLYASLMLARSEALKRNQPIGVCKGTATASAASCTTSGTDGTWEGGWVVHLDPNNPSTLDPNDVLATRLALKAGDTLRVVKTSSLSTKLNGLTYRPDGGASEDASFILCNSDADTTTRRLITVELTGRPRLSQSAGNCTP
ncbi:MAG: GspH/FimT family pseudopilin [Halioglobus sp.]